VTDYDGCAISFGGGVNSVAMTVMLVNEGWRGPIVYAETGCEWPETYSYMEMFERDWLAPRGLTITRIQGAPYQRGKALKALIDYCEQKAVWPTMFQRWCTAYWKIDPLKRWAADHDDPTMLLGIAADESQRGRGKERPLCDRLITRRGCKDIIAAEGLPVPPKSGCYMCMFQGMEQWRELWRKHPDLWARVVRIDDAAYADRGYTLLIDRRQRPLRLRTLAAGFAAQDTLPGMDLCDVAHLRCWACMT
jgi:hypothetical protein